MTCCRSCADRVASSARLPLLEHGGFSVLAGLIHPRDLSGMVAESNAGFGSALRVDVPTDDGSCGRGGRPARALYSAAGAETHTGLYGSRELTQYVADTVGAHVRPSGALGSYSYYVKQGDHLNLHLDVDECDVSLITCVSDTLREKSSAGAGGETRIYVEQIGHDLNEVRRAPDRGYVDVSLEPGASMIILGGLVPHRILPVSAGQARVVSLMCYQFVQ